MSNYSLNQGPATFASHRRMWRTFVTLALLLASVSIALAGPRERAEAIHDRLTGVPATDADLTAMAALPPLAAANYAMTTGANSLIIGSIPA